MFGSHVKITKPAHGRQSWSLGIGLFQHTQPRSHMYPQKARIMIRILNKRNHLGHLPSSFQIFSLTESSWFLKCLALQLSFFVCLFCLDLFALSELPLTVYVCPVDNPFGSMFWKFFCLRSQVTIINTLLAGFQRAPVPSSIQEERSNSFSL